jgi:hypothetical protein
MRVQHERAEQCNTGAIVARHIIIIICIAIRRQLQRTIRGISKHSEMRPRVETRNPRDTRPDGLL